MKRLINRTFIVAAFLSGILPGSAMSGAVTNAEPRRSIFVLPSNPSEGRDPFFPDSSRPYDEAKAAAPHHAPDVVLALTVKGISGVGADRKVIINNHTFGPGETGDVLLPGGGRLHIHCLEINDTSVIIEAAGQRKELIFIPKP